MNTAIAPSGNTTTPQTDDRAGKYLVFELAGEEFGIRVRAVREIIGIQDITPVPHTPHYVKGVINLRGKVIPVIDIRLKFSLPAAEYTQRACIIVVQVTGHTGSILMGIVVDGVAEVLTLAGSEIEDTPKFADGTQIPYIFGMAKVKNRVKILLDINQVLNNQELFTLSSLDR